jgi:hypothetical protein
MRHAAALLAAVLWAAAAAGASAQEVPCADPVDVAPIAKFCQELPKVCVDHGDYVLYDKRHNPRHGSYEGKLPQIRLDSVKVDYYGFGDVWRTEFPYPDPLVRPATSGEETRELQDPQFTSWCVRAYCIAACCVWPPPPLFVCLCVCAVPLVYINTSPTTNNNNNKNTKQQARCPW